MLSKLQFVLVMTELMMKPILSRFSFLSRCSELPFPSHLWSQPSLFLSFFSKNCLEAFEIPHSTSFKEEFFSTKATGVMRMDEETEWTYLIKFSLVVDKVWIGTRSCMRLRLLTGNEAFPSLLLIMWSGCSSTSIGLGILLLRSWLSCTSLIVRVLVIVIHSSHLHLSETLDLHSLIRLLFQTIFKNFTLVRLVHIERRSGGILTHSFQITQLTTILTMMIHSILLIDKVCGRMLGIVYFIMTCLQSLQSFIILLTILLPITSTSIVAVGIHASFILHWLSSFHFHFIVIPLSRHALLHFLGLRIMHSFNCAQDHLFVFLIVFGYGRIIHTV